MMLYFELSNYRKIKLWDEDIDFLKLKMGGEERFKKYLCLEQRKINNKVLIAELMIPRGARIEYGLLGVAYTCNNLNSYLDVSIGSDFAGNKKTISSLISNIEPVNVGIPFEYCPNIFCGVETAFEEMGRSVGGDLRFLYGAYAHVSSSGNIYKKIAHLLLKLLPVPFEEINEVFLSQHLDQISAANVRIIDAKNNVIDY